MGGGGAAVAIMAARMRRIQERVDAFRLADATSPDRARRLEEIGVIEDREMRDLMVDGVILSGPVTGTYYLSEAAYIYQRDRRRWNKVTVVIALAALILGLLLVMLTIQRP